MIFDYFLLDTVDRNLVREGNNNLVKRADELWVFGAVSDGVLAEIELAKSLKKNIRYFKIIKSKDIVEIEKNEVDMEEETEKFFDKL
ncbi:hypothetical protein C0583_04385 [Candidatus Parcubacteria bacterium]|nr:MAG: hypothetical protein C0583_04385 [Candidatus Parcubacteria bacterium]